MPNFAFDMFCPKCASELEMVRGQLTCVRGEMGLSRAMEDGLEASFIKRERVPSERPFSFVIGGRWYCPSDGVRMIEADGVVRCPCCRLSLNEFIGRLVELHPHRP